MRLFHAIDCKNQFTLCKIISHNLAIILRIIADDSDTREKRVNDLVSRADFSNSTNEFLLLRVFRNAWMRRNIA
jgi:hypothetical protein